MKHRLPRLLIVLSFAVLGVAFVNDTPSTDISGWSYTVYTRLAGHPPTQDQLAQMISLVTQNNVNGALDLASRDPDFINITIRSFCSQMAYRNEDPGGPINDFISTCMGIVHDDTPATDFLVGNYIYYFNTNITNKVASDMNPDGEFNMHFGDADNAEIQHFADLGNNMIRSGVQRVAHRDLVNGTSQVTEMIADPEAAGLITTQTFLDQHAAAGTNRRAVEYTLREFTCMPIHDAMDTSVDDSRIGEDVDRAPGGLPSTYQQTCRGCHSVLDGFRGAFAYVDSIYHWTNVQEIPVNSKNDISYKYFRNQWVFPHQADGSGGHLTTDNSWVNNAASGSNASYFGWRGAMSGSGIPSFAASIASSHAFSKCMVDRAIASVCMRDLNEVRTNFTDQTGMVATEANNFEADGYNLRRMFARVAANPNCIDPTQVTK